MIARLCIVALAVVLLGAQEAVLDANLAGNVRKHTSAMADPTVDNYIGRLGRQLAAHVSDGDLAWHFAVIRDNVGGSTHEALSIPGGYVFVPASLILAAGSEAELAGMLAHSIGHITEFREMQNGRQLASIPLVFMGSWTGLGPSENDNSGLQPVAYLKTQRSNELDADRVAVQIMSAAGYDATALLDYIRRTQSARPKVFSALPDRGERMGALEAALANLPTRAARGSNGEFNAIQDRVRRLVAAAGHGTP